MLVSKTDMSIFFHDIAILIQIITIKFHNNHIYMQTYKNL